MNERPLLTRLVPPALRIGVVLALVVVVGWTGFGDAGDELLRKQYYALRGERATNQQVMLVAIDAPTVAAWGAPPYRGSELDGLFAAIGRGKPRVVGAVDEPARLGTLPKAVIAGKVELVYDGDAVRNVILRGTALAQIIPTDRDRITVNYIGKRGLPMVSAVDVASGKIPADAFANKIVVVGLTAQPYAGLVPTPVGARTPAQVQTNALASLSDGVAWQETSPALRCLVIVLVCLLAVMLAHHLAMVSSWIATAATAIALVVFDYILFATGSTLFGATLPLVATFAAAACERIYERIVLHHHVRDIAHWTRRWMLLESMRTEVPDDKPGYWRRVGQLARLYLGCSSSIIAELPEGHERLKMRVLGGTGTQQIRERRMDIGRAPYRKAHLTLGPVWHDEFMADGTKTLLVPLVIGGAGRNTALIGFWMVSFEEREAVTEAHMALIKTLAKEIAMAIDRRRTAVAPQLPRGITGWLFGARKFSRELEEVRRAFETHTQNQQDLLTLGESMPFGVFVATLWGDIRYSNTAMKASCLEEGLDPTASNTDLAELVSKLSGRRAREVHRHLRELVQGHQELHLRGRDRGDKASHDIMLSWLKSTAEEGEQLLVGCVLPRSLRMRTANPPMRSPADDSAVTAQHAKYQAIDVDGDSAVIARAPTHPSSTEEGLQLAQGTPKFMRASEPDALPPLPDATFKLRRVDEEELLGHQPSDTLRFFQQLERDDG